MYILYFYNIFSGIALEVKDKVNYVKLLPENLFVALNCCLDDLNDRVAMAAAIALYTLERPNEKVCLKAQIKYLITLCDKYIPTKAFISFAS